jgi:hypothetical protein
MALPTTKLYPGVPEFRVLGQIRHESEMEAPLQECPGYVEPSPAEQESLTVLFPVPPLHHEDGLNPGTDPHAFTP